MHATIRVSTIVLALTGLAGCRQLEREIDYHFGWMHAPHAGAGHAVARHHVYRKTRRVAEIAKPERFQAGSRMRQWCGQRHIQFQRGTLRESDAEKAHNNELCRRAYTG